MRKLNRFPIPVCPSGEFPIPPPDRQEKGVIMAYDNTDILIVKTINGFRKTFGKNYCFPTQKKILDKLKEYHGITICRRTLNYHLRKIEDLEVIKRTKRHYRGTLGNLICRSTLYFWGKRFHDFMAHCKHLGMKIMNLLGVQSIAQYHKNSTNLLFKMSPQCGKLVNNSP